MSRPSNTLKTKAAKHDFSAPIPPNWAPLCESRSRLRRRSQTPSSSLLQMDMAGASGLPVIRVIGKDQHWRVHVTEAIKLAAKEAKERKAKRSKVSAPICLMGGSVRGKTDPQRGSVALRQAIINTELASPLKGFTVRLIFEDEAPAIGSGQRLVLVQFRGKKVILHGDGYTATIKRDVFKELVAINRRRRKRNPVKIDRLPADRPSRVNANRL